MNNKKVETLLRKLEVPEPDTKTVERTIEYAKLAFLASPEEFPERRISFQWKPILLACSIAIAVLFLVPREGSRKYPPQREYAMKGDEKLLGEMLDIFQGNLKAVVANGGAPQVVLGALDSPAQMQPVVVNLNKDGKLYRVLTFSGESLEVSLGKDVLKFEVYVTGEGKIIIVGENTFWSSDSSAKLGSYQVQAHPLGKQI